MTSPARRRSIGGPELVGLTLIGLGFLFLLDRLGWFRFSWSLVWPILLIGIGALVLIGATGRGRMGGEERVAVQRDATDQLELDLRVGAGRFSVAGGATGLVEARSDADDIETRVERTGRRARVRLGHVRPWFPFGQTGATRWEIRIGTDLPTRLDVAAGAGDFDIDLSSVRIVDARLSVGAAQARIVLPRPIGEVPVRLTAGASDVTIVVPAGVEARVQGSGGLISFDGRRETPGFAQAADRVAVQVDGGAASVKVA
jgi:hypothetical protein